MLQLEMPGRKKSLKRKIIAGYIGGFLIILTIASIIFINLMFIEERVKFHTVITRFVDTVLEIRRYEKNYFLYKQLDDLAEALKYIKIAINIVRTHRDKFDSVELHASSDNLREGTISESAIQILLQYRELLGKDYMENPRPGNIEKEIRKLGHDITEMAEILSESEGAMIRNMINSARRTLVVAVLFFFAGSLVIAFVVSTLVIRPLKELERSMQRIASGKFEMLPISSEDNEIISLKEAFDRMIKEIFSQRDVIRSEKLTSLGTMLAGIAHEINNPLFNICTSAEILSEEIDSSDREFRKQMISQIIQETDRARDIVRSVLEFTRDREFSREKANLSNLFFETMRFIRSDIPPHITIKIDIPEELNVFVDRQKFQHVILNLLKNAVDSIPDEGREEKISIKAGMSHDDTVVITISDTGKGIPDDIIGRIFDPFFTTKDVGKGTGLGLFVTHNIIEQHKGKISVESQPGKGTTFTIKLPIGADEL
jgi:signal transduction histidine kinase